MKVKDLIIELSKFPQDAIVEVLNPWAQWDYVDCPLLCNDSKVRIFT